MNPPSTFDTARAGWARSLGRAALEKAARWEAYGAALGREVLEPKAQRNSTDPDRWRL